MKKLGQHFLINKKKIKKIVDALNLKPNETVIEIGPGHGELTLELRIKNAELKIIAIEKDRKLTEFLRQKFSGDKNIKIIEGDALKILPDLCSKFNALGFKITGNIPYYITGYLLRIIAELKNKPSLVVLTVQKEVGERICAKPPQMNLLAASVQFWAEPKIAGYISKKDFCPAPKVDSAIIKLTPKTKNLTPEQYYQFIKILFKQPRKTILNNLATLNEGKTTNKEEIIKKLQKIGVNPQDRPQNLNIEQIKKLSTFF